MSGVFVTIFAEPTPPLTEFYERLGIRLTEERHGGGPTHLSAQVDSVLEFLPPRSAVERLAGVAPASARQKELLLGQRGRASQMLSSTYLMPSFCPAKTVEILIFFLSMQMRPQVVTTTSRSCIG
jgi:hypothetical protein